MTLWPEVVAVQRLHSRSTQETPTSTGDDSPLILNLNAPNHPTSHEDHPTSKHGTKSCFPGDVLRMVGGRALQNQRPRYPPSQGLQLQPLFPADPQFPLQLAAPLASCGGSQTDERSASAVRCHVSVESADGRYASCCRPSRWAAWHTTSHTAHTRTSAFTHTHAVY